MESSRKLRRRQRCWAVLGGIGFFGGRYWTVFFGIDFFGGPVLGGIGW